MTKPTDQNTSLGAIAGLFPARSLFMAYTLNNQQPVQCTMVSEEPHFYMDEEAVCDDDHLLEDVDLENMTYDLDAVQPNILETELTQLKNKVDAYERISLEFSKSEDERLQQFMMDSHFLSNGAPSADKQTVLDGVKDSLSKSLYANALLDFAKSNDIDLEISDQVETAVYDKAAGKILLRGDMDQADMVLLAAQELRRHWQHHNGALVHPLTFHPDQAVLINRAQLADLAVAKIRVAWDLKLSGQNNVWARIENSSMSDLGRAHAREALADFRTLNNGKAASAVFETWFLSERCRAQDKKLIQAMLADYRGYVFDCAEASRMVSIDLICALGEQPGINGSTNAAVGKNYLAPFAQMILGDSIFTDVRDRSNANFLWFIKFERDFTEAEQELQSSSDIKKLGDTDQADNKDIFEDIIHENAFTEADKEYLRQSIFDNETKGDDNVIRIEFGSDKQREGISS